MCIAGYLVCVRDSTCPVTLLPLLSEEVDSLLTVSADSEISVDSTVCFASTLSGLPLLNSGSGENIVFFSGEFTVVTDPELFNCSIFKPGGIVLLSLLFTINSVDDKLTSPDILTVPFVLPDSS